MKPMEIEARSMAIIESELHIPLDDEIKPIVKRVIHTTADFSFAETLYFSCHAVPLMRAMMKDGVTLITDTNMALAGVNRKASGKLGIKLICLMAETAIADEAGAREVTRAQVSMEHALEIPGRKLFVCGNSPTFLFPLAQAAPLHDAAVIAVPVGFVNVVEAKEAIIQSGLPCIAARGRRGGSNVAAAIVNALMYGMEGIRECG